MNRLLSNLLIVAMFLGFTALPFVCGLCYLVLAFCVYGVCFGFEEFLANHYTGNTVSQHIWILNDSKSNQGQKLLYSILIGWICFVLHFVFVGFVSKFLFGLFFFLIAATVISWFINKFLFGVLVTFDILFGAWEGFSMIRTGKSISTNVQIFDVSNPLMVTLFCISFIGIGVFLFIHFKAKRWFGKK